MIDFVNNHRYNLMDDYDQKLTRHENTRSDPRGSQIIFRRPVPELRQDKVPEENFTAPGGIG